MNCVYFIHLHCIYLHNIIPQSVIIKINNIYKYNKMFLSQPKSEKMNIFGPEPEKTVPTIGNGIFDK